MNDAPIQYRCSPRVVVTALADGTGVLLDLESLFYFSLNQTGLVIWRSLERGAATVDALAEAIVGEFEIDLPRARADVGEVLETLLAERLVERCAA